MAALFSRRAFGPSQDRNDIMGALVATQKSGLGPIFISHQS
jgi:hypothetical protein